MSAKAKVGGIVIDCRDPESLARFWAELLGTDQVEPLGDPVHYVLIGTAEPRVPYISFQRVPEPKTQKTRVHLDLKVEDLEEATATVERLGGSRGVDIQEYGYSWRTMADPEGNEFCMVPARASEGSG